MQLVLIHKLILVHSIALMHSLISRLNYSTEVFDVYAGDGDKSKWPHSCHWHPKHVHHCEVSLGQVIISGSLSVLGDQIELSFLFPHI